MANAGTLFIEIATNVARLTKDMDDAKKAVGSAMADVEKYVGYAKTAFITLSGVTSIAAFKGIVEGAIEAKAKLYDVSSQTGITVEALSDMARFGKYSGTSIDEIAAASNKLNKSLLVQNEESKGAAQAIKALGLNFDNFKQQAPDQQLLTLAKAMNTFRDGGEKGAVAMTLLGKTGAGMLPYLRELAQAESLVGKQTTESAKQAHDYEVNLIKLSAAGQAWKRELATYILPTLVDWTNGLIDAKKAYGGWFAAFTAGHIDTSAGIGAALKKSNSDLDAALSERAKIVADKASDKPGAKLAAAMGVDDSAIANLDARIAKMKGNQSYLIAQQMRSFQDDPAELARRSFRPRLKFSDDGGASTKTARDDYTPLVKLINEKIAADRAEFESITKLTEGQKMQAKFFADVDGGYLKLTLDQKLSIDGMLQEVLAIEKKNQAKEAEARWIKEAIDANAQYIESQMQVRDQLQQQARDARLQLDLYGLTGDELKVLESLRLRESAATLRQKQALAELDGFMPEVARLYREQADAIMATAAARDELAARESFASTDVLSGADRAVKEYLDRVKRAGDETYGAVANSLKGLEDLTLTALNGSDTRNAARAWVNGIIAEAERLYIVKPLLASIFGGGNGVQGWLGTFGAKQNGSYNANYQNEGLNYPAPVQLATGTDFVPYDGMLARLHRGERVTPAAFNPAAGGRGAGGLNVVIENHGADVRQQVETGPGGEQQLRVIVRQAVEQAKRELTADVASGTGTMTSALKARGVPMGNGSIRRT